jgi:hypothetical protein
LLQNFCIDIFRSCFERIFIFSPSINLDHVWHPVKKYIREELGVDEAKEPFCFDTYNEEALERIIAQQFKLAEYMKEKGKFVYSILIIADDMATNVQFMRNSRLLNDLYVRGRHAFISVITSVQKVVAVSSMIRTQATHTFTFRLRNFQDLQIWLEENSAIVSKKQLLQFYDYSTSQPYGFIYIDLTAQLKSDSFYYKFQAKLVPSSSSSASLDDLAHRAALPAESHSAADAAPGGA